MSKDFLHLRRWMTGEGYPECFTPRPVILECIPSRSGMSMGVYDRGKRIFTINGCGFDRHGAALGEFLEACFQPELTRRFLHSNNPSGLIHLEGSAGFESMAQIAQAIGLKVYRSESKAGTLIVIEKGA